MPCRLLRCLSWHLMPGAMMAGTVLLAPTQCVAADAVAQGREQGYWLVRVMALEVDAIHVASEIPIIGGKITIPSKAVPGMDLSYFVTDHWAVECQGGVFARDYRIRNSRIGDFDVGTVESGTVSLTVQYHVRPHATLSPYLGLGINYAWPHAVRPAGGIPDFEVRGITSAILNLGVDYRVADHWRLSTSVRYVSSPAYRFTGHGFGAVVEVDTLVVGVGVGYRF